jgi:hypothetical protein
MGTERVQNADPLVGGTLSEFCLMAGRVPCINVIAAEASTVSLSKNCPIRVSNGKPVTAGAIKKMLKVPANSARDRRGT